MTEVYATPSAEVRGAHAPRAAAVSGFAPADAVSAAGAEGRAASHADNAAAFAPAAGGFASSRAAAPLLSVRQISKVYGNRDSVTNALAGISFDVDAGEFVAIMGPSGSGKTTLLNCIATIDTATSGHIVLAGRDITTLRSRSLAKFRRDDLGFIFQDSNLLDTLTGFENIALALTIKGTRPAEVADRVRALADALGVAGVLEKYPHQMSGGQKQRIAAARAIVADPKLVLADEPTGALDSRSAAVMLETLEMMNAQMKATIMMVTHDSFAASFANRVLFIKDGSLFNELRRGDASRGDFFNRIMEVVAFLGGDASAPMRGASSAEAIADVRAGAVASAAASQRGTADARARESRQAGR